MSGFKRIQSKVFWGQMANHDLENIPLLNHNLNIPRQFQSAYYNLGRDSDTDTDKNTSDNSINNIQMSVVNEINESDDITTINLLDNVINDKKCELSSLENQIDNQKHLSISKNVKQSDLNIRPFSPLLDHGHRSLDSGFSDSDRSKSPDLPDSDPKKRKKRRRKSKDHMKVHPRINSLWKDNETPPNPTFTSTPIRDNQLINLTNVQNFICDSPVNRIVDKNEDAISKREEKEEEDEPVRRFPIEEECLGDFLYASEPPEDDDIPIQSSRSTSTSRGSTPSFNGPWYTKISNESSSKYSFENNQRLATADDKNQSSIKAWINDIMFYVENECSITLQSKALPKKNYFDNIYDEESQTKELKMLTSAATSAATQLLIRVDGFDKNIQEVTEKIVHLEAGRNEREYLRSIEDEAFSILSELGAPPPRRIHEGSLRSILSQLESLKKMVNHALETRLDFYIERVVRGLEEAPRESGSVARGALAALTALGLAGKRAGDSIARCSGVRALLTSLISAGRLSSELRASTLRALSSVCCSPLAINNFVDEGGPEIIVDLLTSKGTPENEKMESVALIVQITAPWTNAIGLAHLERFFEVLINTLTHLSEDTTCSQTLLLCAAALNNLSSSVRCIHAIIYFDTVRKLLKCIKKTPGCNIWLMEQVANLIEKLSKYPEARRYLANAKASVALICFLKMAPPGLESTYQRLSSTATSALTRLCVDPDIAKQVVAVGGADCLPNLQANNDCDEEIGLFKYTKSLRIASKNATKCINEAKARDYSLE